MWRDIEDRTLPRGVVSVEGSERAPDRVLFGAKTVKAWKLDKYRSVTPQENSNPSLIAFQFFKDSRGKRAWSHSGHRGASRAVSCQRSLKNAGAKKGRYLAVRDKDNFVVVDFSHKLPAGWTPQH